MTVEGQEKALNFHLSIIWDNLQQLNSTLGRKMQRATVLVLLMRVGRLDLKITDLFLLVT